MANFDALTSEVTNIETVDASAVTLINGIAAQIEAAVAADNLADDSAAAALAARLRASADNLAAAISANTTPPTV